MPRNKSFTVEWALDRALEVFVERGYHGTSMEAIRGHLKLSRSSIYLSFHSKLELFVRALRRHTGADAAVLGELNDPGSPRAALVKVFEMASVGREAQPPALRLLIEAALGRTRREPEIVRLEAETFVDMERRFRAAIERGQAAAEIAIADGVDPETTARVLLGLYLGLYLIAGHDASGERVEAVLQQVESLLPVPGRT